MPREESWDISAELAKILKTKGWSQGRLARETGFARTDITRMLRADPDRVLKVGVERATKIAETLNVSVLDLGLPPEEAGEEGQTVATLLDELATKLADAEEVQMKMQNQIRRLQTRVRTLEAVRVPDGAAPTGRRR